MDKETHIIYLKLQIFLFFDIDTTRHQSDPINTAC